ncbi:Catechol 2,3-dioxygenase [Sphingomonas laterariae]|uniref:Catechol 2,3-dioxygenase n=1 Tax=Edaphosphingomonas laterariae TaxID=861865 RepID=A0A239CVV6_9SPHN|nr:VOC family protein [Sphingomonas laterariae]SNS24230.1 Catechol 2,3-dioxygenase [Sphingomonas laterariae]
MTGPAMYRPRPDKLGHLVLKVRDVQASLAFYRDVVGLDVSDWIDDRMVFLRCGQDHHDLALLQMTPDEVAGHQPGRSPVEHFSYHVAGLAEIEQIAAMLQARGVEIDRGIGKHGPGANAFLVFRDPDGNNVEFYCDMIQIGPDHPPHEARVWDGREMETFDRWALEHFLVAPPARIQKLIDDKGGA